MWKIFFGLSVVLNFLLVYLLVMARFFPLEPGGTPRIVIYQHGEEFRAIVEFVDHPPWCHSRFYDADYDYERKTITLQEYYVPFHPFSKPIQQHCELVLRGAVPGSYKVYLGKRFLGDIQFSNGKIIWQSPANYPDSH